MIRTIPVVIQIDGESVEFQCDIDFTIHYSRELELNHCWIEELPFPTREQLWAMDRQAEEHLSKEGFNIVIDADMARGEEQWEASTER